MKKTILRYGMVLLLISLITKTGAQPLTVGLRSGITSETAGADYYGSKSMLHNLSWDQQLFLDIALSKRFHLEPSLSHYSVGGDLSGQKEHAMITGGKYYRYIFRNQVFRNQVLLLYSFLKKSRLSVSGGAGFGVNITHNHYDMAYPEKGIIVAHKNSLISFEAISAALAINARYQLNRKVDLNAQSSCFTFTNASLSGYSIRLGAGYRLF
jgi:hypothetical protein